LQKGQTEHVNNSAWPESRLVRRPEISPRYEMKVAMEYCLPGCKTVVYANIESLPIRCPYRKPKTADRDPRIG